MYLTQYSVHPTICFMENLRIDENYPWIIIKYPFYLFHCPGGWNIDSKAPQFHGTAEMMMSSKQGILVQLCPLLPKGRDYEWLVHKA